MAEEETVTTEGTTEEEITEPNSRVSGGKALDFSEIEASSSLFNFNYTLDNSSKAVKKAPQIKFNYYKLEGIKSEMKAALKPYEDMKGLEDIYSVSYQQNIRQQVSKKIQEIRDKYYSIAMEELEKAKKVYKDRGEEITQSTSGDYEKRLNANMVASMVIPRLSGKELTQFYTTNKDNPEVVLMVQAQISFLERDHPTGFSKTDLEKLKKLVMTNNSESNQSEVANQLFALESTIKQAFRVSTRYPANWKDGQPELIPLPNI